MKEKTFKIPQKAFYSKDHLESLLRLYPAVFEKKYKWFRYFLVINLKKLGWHSAWGLYYALLPSYRHSEVLSDLSNLLHYSDRACYKSGFADRNCLCVKAKQEGLETKMSWQIHPAPRGDSLTKRIKNSVCPHKNLRYLWRQKRLTDGRVIRY